MITLNLDPATMVIFGVVGFLIGYFVGTLRGRCW